MTPVEILDAAIADYHAREHKEYGCPACPVLVELEVDEAVATRAALGAFTREDVQMLRQLKLDHSAWQFGGEAQPTHKVLDLADRIEALLPPEPK